MVVTIRDDYQLLGIVNVIVARQVVLYGDQVQLAIM